MKCFSWIWNTSELTKNPYHPHFYLISGKNFLKNEKILRSSRVLELCVILPCRKTRAFLAILKKWPPLKGLGSYDCSDFSEQSLKPLHGVSIFAITDSVIAKISFLDSENVPIFESPRVFSLTDTVFENFRILYWIPERPITGQPVLGWNQSLPRVRTRSFFGILPMKADFIFLKIKIFQSSPHSGIFENFRPSSKNNFHWKIAS